jgi:hypothetical protein
MIRDMHPVPYPDVDFLPIPDPHPDPQHYLEGLSLNNIDEESGMPARAQNQNKCPKIF